MGNQRLIVITPDAVIPDVMLEFEDDRLVWVNFDTLVEMITSVVVLDEKWLTSESPIPTEREQELLRELVKFLELEGLTGVGDDVLVVPARKAYPDYKEHSAYICQPNRSFRPCSHMAFYFHGSIQKYLPKILTTVESVELSSDGIAMLEDLEPDTRAKLRNLVDQLKQAGDERYGELHKVLFLSNPTNDVDTLQLENEIVNDLTSDRGKTIAFTQNQRYIPMSKFEDNPTVTTELLDS